MFRFFILTSLTLASVSNADIFRYSSDGKYVDIKINIYESIRLNENCFAKEKPNCLAYKASKVLATNETPSKTDTIGHPASRNCGSRNGSSRILITKDDKQFDYCQFADGSMIDSWDLYYRNYPRNR
ncbi:MAG: DUF333 domain-containing protein [Bdellovibrionales bacterium]|nr:DUF333 domain-containing protein [Oligoflexia bacterium]